MADDHRELVIGRIIGAGRVGREAPDLAAVAREVGRGLRVRRCRIALVGSPGGVDGTGAGNPGAGNLGAGDGSASVAEPAEAIEWHDWAAESRAAAPGPLRLHEVLFAGTPVGWLALSGPVLFGARRRLLRDVLTVLGPVLDAARLAVALRRELDAAVAHAEEIASSRRRTVAQMDDRRRALERNLHDGAQHHLVNLRLTLGLLEHEVAAGDAVAVVGRIDALAEQVGAAEAVLRDTAAGILPVGLVTGGLRQALQAEVGRYDGVTLSLPDGPPRRYPAAVETAVFYACLEAVTNARKHAPGAETAVVLRDTYRGLWFAVSDRGPGFDPAGLPAGSRLGHISDRVAAAGGTVTVRSAPGAGTVLEGIVPI
ncbi:sensor histidine kinase [Solwaraspora sp. WMMB335]|uniref:sensor histidine kinase n=1 Tax=Solwaraspora sp. WMMB335 TaxID=3404118 RepID=UPI003B95EA1F